MGNMFKNFYLKQFEINYSFTSLIDLFKDEFLLFVLDSAADENNKGRYSFLGFDPFETFSSSNPGALAQLKTKYNSYKEFFDYSDILSEDLPPFISGVVGYISYDYGLSLEQIKNYSLADICLPNIYFGFYDTIICFDNQLQKIYVISTGLPENNLNDREIKASSKIKYIEDKINRVNMQAETVEEPDFSFKLEGKLQFKTNFSREKYLSTINQILEYIKMGEIYQLNLSQRFDFDLDNISLDPIELYKNLRRISPVSFGCFLDCGNFKILSNSPERFLKLTGDVVETVPMKGTRPRGRIQSEDQALREEIERSEKDKAELLMITDLQRNDIGRVCKYGSVEVKDLRTIEEYKTVFQATSTISGILRSDKDAFDLITACFPGGSITGCPKIRAMQIIEELEPTKRTIYTGCLGYIDYRGNMDFNILIRTLLLKDNKMYFQVGGGIVYDSDPESEYEETLVKAFALKKSIEETILD